MYKTRKSIISLLMAMVMMVAFCVPAMAADSIAQFKPFEEDTSLGELEQVEESFKNLRAGRVFVTGLEVYAYKSSTNQITTNPVASASWVGTAFPNVTVPYSTFQDCANFGCDYWIVYMSFEVEGTPSRIAIYANDGLLLNQSISAGYYNYNYATPFSSATQQFRLTLDGSGATAFGNIYIG